MAGSPQRHPAACRLRYLNRDIPALIRAGGLSISRLDTYYSEGEPKPFAWSYEGVATLT